MMATLQQASDWMSGELRGENRDFDGLSIDTRSLASGDLFFALRGPNFDGHDYVANALECGATAAVVDHEVDIDGPQLVVDDVRDALGSLGRSWRRQYRPLTVGITGSNGKTTLKEMIAAVFARCGHTLATEGNLNNDLGVPLMLCRLRDEHEFAVFEMGANHVGEIAYLTSLVEPDIVLLGNAGPAHLEGFGSLDGVARGKGEILQGTPRPRCAILNRDDAYYDFWRPMVDDIDCLSFGLGEGADVRATDIQSDASSNRFRLHTDDGVVDVELPLSGSHNVRNACAAAAVARAAGIGNADIAAGLAAVSQVGGRIKSFDGIAGSRLFDDSYNANPVSVAAAGDFLGALPGQRLFVLGDMFELGDDEKQIHEDVGRTLKAAGIDELHATGDLCRHAVTGFGDGACWYADVDALVSGLAPQLDSNSKVLVKGSRSMRMERVVSALRAAEVN